MSASKRNSQTIAAGIKLGVFTVVSILVTGLLTVLMGNIGFGETRVYQAAFTNASALSEGDDVKVAGVSVGQVSAVEHYERKHALVTFEVERSVPLTTASRAEIRYLNLVGDRYLALEKGQAARGAQELTEDDVIPMDQTEPALDLTALFNGFKPLFQALQPDQVNELSMNIVQVLQGEGGTVRSLLESTASLTNTLADRDRLIGDVVDNLTTTLETIDSRREQLSTLVVELKRWMTDLARDRDTIGESLGSISELSVVLADLLKEGRPLLKEDVEELRRLSRLLNEPKNTAKIVDIFERLPEQMTDQTRTGTYGSWYNYYICGFQMNIKLPLISGLPIIKKLNQQLEDLNFRSDAARCSQP